MQLQTSMSFGSTVAAHCRLSGYRTVVGLYVPAIQLAGVFYDDTATAKSLGIVK